ncbi:6-phosphogluconolactonase [Aquariibacter lacus]|nr:6-phosphogluconolactonase [Piscinibacter lacus]
MDAAMLAQLAPALQARWPHLRLRQPPGEEALKDLVETVADTLRAAVTEGGAATLAVSGGRSPVALFEALRTQALPWAQITVTLVDERWVADGHPDRNDRLVRAHLLQGPAAAARFVPLIAPGPLPPLADAAAAADARIAALPPADLVLLGMGADAHTASLFPGSPDLAAGLDPQQPARVLAMRLPDPPPQPAHPRLSWTLAHLLRARALLLPLQGADKLATLARVVADPARPASPAWPIAHLLQQTAVPLTLWLPH